MQHEAFIEKARSLVKKIKKPCRFSVRNGEFYFIQEGKIRSGYLNDSVRCDEFIAYLKSLVSTEKPKSKAAKSKKKGRNN